VDLQTQIVERLRQDFLDDVRDRLTTLEAALDSLYGGPPRDGVPTPEPAEALAEIRREAHNIKGTGASFGFPVLGLIAHRLEDYLSLVEFPTARHLSEAQRFVDVMGGIVERGENPDEAEGAKIVRELPARWRPDAQAIQVRHEEALVATSSRVIGHLIEGKLQAHGFRVITAGNAIDVLEVGIRTRPDFVAVSAMFDGIRGVDLARAFAAMAPTRNIRFAILTSFAPGHPELAGLPEGAAVIRTGEGCERDLCRMIAHCENGLDASAWL
jgi:HPt (histidine-containing phosphotransfer) domain-containing protein